MQPAGRYKFLLLQSLFTIWFRQAHVIESTYFCRTRATGQTKAKKFTTIGE